ncbi:hypothetical protein P3X46_032111 [Hevea brasiliensis]|uniref:Protein kinase domain-containing protein n=1 Tax=Hevea brasiliensis TaxID=3981 RepID=A0ABQ9KMI6_HEVBR|nr:uncharacterized protein LOC110643065 [Hevea brasiliensis]XP_021650984.2 uncharacterized protein LOC110643065 [Hevea brasiliensis]KAJ9141596.1 hypothetical protein P3X46_032111 [Hevea brasiliensis]KAJ9141597.1 hypothetical protein P3X46_032111 [Hevea brasiliensis]
MADTSSVDVILGFLRRNRFTRAEAALRSELNNHPDLNGFLKKLSFEDKELGKVLEEENGSKPGTDNQVLGSQNSFEVSNELIIKEIECGTGRNGSESKWRNSALVGEWSGKPNEAIGTIDSEGSVLDLYSWKFNARNGRASDPYQNDGGTAGNCTSRAIAKSGEEVIVSGEKRCLWPGSTSTNNSKSESKYERTSTREPKELDQQLKAPVAYSAENTWKDCPVKTVFPFPKGDVSTSYDVNTGLDKREGKKKPDICDVRVAIKEQVDEVGRALYLGKSQGGTEQKNLSVLSFSLASDNPKEEFPRLPPVKLKTEDKPLNVNWQEKFEPDGLVVKHNSTDNTFLIGSYLDVPVGQEINSSGGKRIAGGSWLSVSQGITEDTSDLVSGFATVGDGLSESIGYPNEYWDSDEYDDDDDVGYMRQPIEDEAWFLAHEIDYPSDNEKGTGLGSVPDPQERGPTKDEDDDQSFAEEDSYFSGEQYFQSKKVEPITASDDPIGLSVAEMYRRTDENDLIAQYDGQLMDEEELNLMRTEPVWQGFVPQTNELIMLGDEKAMNDCGKPWMDDTCVDDYQHGSVRSIGVGMNSDAADFGSEVRESLVGGSSEGDIEYFHEHDVGIGGLRPSHPESDKKYIDRHNRDEKRISKQDSNTYVSGNDKVALSQVKDHRDGGFSFPPPLRDGDGQLGQAGSGKSLCSNNSKTIIGAETGDQMNASTGTDDMLAAWRQKSSDSSTVKSSRDENNVNAVRSAASSPSTLSNYGYAEQEHAKKEENEKIGFAREEDSGALLEDEEAAAVQEQLRQIKAQEEEFETFNLKVVHRKNRTGFEEDKNFHVVLNSVIAGRYHVTEYLGSAAFSKAIQAHDLHTGMDVCVKIIKNNKDFFDQSLDEIKLLKYVNKHDPADKYHILRLYDYFYYREHLLIVCELLKANLYEFHKFNRESGGEVYFTMPRLQSITIQCLEALQFLHGLRLIHCDLKPENILVKSYSRCEVKVIDLGSSCFETDHLCSYVQSRSYRAPEVILGLSYDKKIDIWSLGCILAELCTGNVLFQNDSPATLLARVIGIIGPIDQIMLAKGRDTYKYFTKNHMLYERNQDTNRLEYLIPKKTSLRHRLPMGDQGFVDFVAHLLEINPKKRPSASEALKHPWLSYPYEPISA